MIRLPITDADLLNRIDGENATWRARAQARTAEFVANGAYQDRGNFWSDIKLVFMRLQNFKCVFCERPLAREAVGVIEHDVEHFRPKGRVTAWPKARGPTYGFSTGGPAPNGYFWLAYDPLNYATACKPCNSTLKSDAFPIAGSARGAVGATPAQLLATEKPFLIYPIGSSDDDPEDLITFEGISAKPKVRSGHRKRRAEVTIDFFRLNTREELWHERFHVIRAMFDAYDITQTSAFSVDRQGEASDTLKSMTHARSPHASCARRFLELLNTDRTAAWNIYTSAKAYLSQPI